MSKYTIDKKFIIDRQGKPAVLYAGLLETAHNAGLKRITTKMLQSPSEDNRWTAIWWAEVEMESGTYSGTGDANADNVTKMVAPHYIRMAETRAKARALRDALSITAVAVEELGEDVDRNTSEITSKSNRPATAERIANMPSPTLDDISKPRPGDRIVPKDDPIWTDKPGGILARADKAVNLGVDIKTVLAELGITKWAGGLTLTQCDELRGRLGIEIASREPAIEPVPA